MNTPSAAAPRHNKCVPSLMLRRWAIAVFIVWQIAFIVLANALPLLRRPATHGISLPRPLSVWLRLTAITPGWGFFAEITPQCSFFEVELQWPEKRLRVPSVFEPEDPSCYFHPVLTSHRLHNYIERMKRNQEFWDATNLAAAPPGGWQQYMARILRIHGAAMFSFMNWHLQEYLRNNPAAPAPNQVLLNVRLYEKLTPADDNAGERTCVQRPLLRWRPGCEPSQEFWPMEVFDPNLGKFELYPFRHGPTDEN